MNSRAQVFDFNNISDQCNNPQASGDHQKCSKQCQAKCSTWRAGEQSQ